MVLKKLVVSAANAILATEGQSVTFVYVDDIKVGKTFKIQQVLYRTTNISVATGGTETTCGNDKIHTFTGPGTFTVFSTVGLCAANNVVSYLVVAGGGGGGYQSTSGGGGAGGFREVKNPTNPYTASPLDGYPSAPNRITVNSTILSNSSSWWWKVNKWFIMVVVELLQLFQQLHQLEVVWVVEVLPTAGRWRIWWWWSNTEMVEEQEIHLL